MPAKAKNDAVNNNQRPARLAPHLDKNLLGYAACASAAGVSLLALAQPAEAKIIYTAANIPIAINAPAVSIDLNHDGIADFSFINATGGSDAVRRRTGERPPEGFNFAVLYVLPTQPANEIGAITSFTKAVCAAELLQGREVSTNRNFQPGPLDMFAFAGDYTSPGTANCPWQRNHGGYLALEFVVKGKTYFGWARVSLTGTSPTITGYAYENIPGQSIKTGDTQGSDEKGSISNPPVLNSPAPQPASLGILAHGASGLAAWRRPEEMN
jgi:hypothetical protein